MFSVSDSTPKHTKKHKTGVCHVALAQEGHCLPGEVLLGTDSVRVLISFFWGGGKRRKEEEERKKSGVNKVGKKVLTFLSLCLLPPLPFQIKKNAAHLQRGRLRPVRLGRRQHRRRLRPRHGQAPRQGAADAPLRPRRQDAALPHRQGPDPAGHRRDRGGRRDLQGDGVYRGRHLADEHGGEKKVFFFFFLFLVFGFFFELVFFFQEKKKDFFL